MSRRRVTLIIASAVLVITGVATVTVLLLLGRGVTVQVRGLSESFAYDGTRHRVPGLEGADGDGTVHVTGSDGRTYTVSGLHTSGEVRTPSDSLDEVRVRGRARVVDETGLDVTDRVGLDIVPGSVRVEPRDLWLESGDATKVFDGGALTNGGAALVREEGFVGLDGASYRFTGSQTAPGESPNTFDVAWDVGTDSSCYEVHKETGTLSVTSRPKKELLSARVIGGIAEVGFDGSEHSYSAVSGDSERIKVNGVEYDVVGIECSPATGERIGTYESRLSEGDDFGVYLSSDEAHENDLSDQFDISFVPGELTIRRGDMYVGTFFGDDYDWTDSVYVSDDCETFRKVGEVPSSRRDPSIIWRDGRFWTITCLNEQDGHVWFDVCSSTDLVTWAGPSVCGPFDLDSLPLVHGAEFGEFDVVAPEWFLDDDGSVSIIASCGSWGANYGRPTDDHMMAYLFTVSDLSCDGSSCSLSIDGPGRKMSVNADEDDRIDGTIDHMNGAWWLTIKRHGLSTELWRNDRLAADGWVLVRDKALYGFEGNCVIELGSDRLCMFADGVPDVAPYGVRRWVSGGLEDTWVEKPLHFLDESGHEIGTVRHGTVLRVAEGDDEAERKAVDALLAKATGN